MRVLVTGGAGYIGSHTCVELVAAGHDVVVVDDLSNASPAVAERVARVAGRPVELVHARVQDEARVRAALRGGVDAAIHFAAFKAVGESVAQPLRYYENNLGSLASLARLMGDLGAKHVVFSSSATVYGDPERVPIPESARLAPANPYGWTKLVGEQMLRDLAAADPSWKITLLRYFNPVGAHPSGLIGEDPRGTPNNLMPYVSQVAVGRLPELRVFGGDYPTRDGTGVRDYLHVVDLARGHVRALERTGASGLLTVNLGTGRGYSVLEVVQAFERASGRKIAYRIVERRPGDVAEVYADASLAARALGWTAERGIETMCRDAWNWQRLNPAGYGSGPGA
ncbi:MAG: UDP-glucose 4-epimerase GalE [Bacteroidota bacterium]